MLPQAECTLGTGFEIKIVPKTLHNDLNMSVHKPAVGVVADARFIAYFLNHFHPEPESEIVLADSSALLVPQTNNISAGGLGP